MIFEVAVEAASIICCAYGVLLLLMKSSQCRLSNAKGIIPQDGSGCRRRLPPIVAYPRPKKVVAHRISWICTASTSSLVKYPREMAIISPKHVTMNADTYSVRRDFGDFLPKSLRTVGKTSTMTLYRPLANHDSP